jgi:5-deoxy-glucuronate isomerase
MQYTTDTIVVRPQEVAGRDPDLIVEVTPARAGWDLIHFQARRLAAGHSWTFATGENELALVVLSGTLDVDTNRGQWHALGKRDHVFAGLPYAIYLPRRTDLTVAATRDSEFAVAWVPTDEDHRPRIITPADVHVEVRGGDNVTRQINDMIPPGFGCQRLVVVEVYTPGGSWSSYPPHKHDVRRVDADGKLIEADLDEVYFYKFERPEGYAYQRVYTGETSPLQIAGHPIDALPVVRNNDVVLVPEGYHPVVCPPGYNTYYLNVLAGSDQALTAADDPLYTWVKQTYKTPDPRLPLYAVERRP